MASIYPVGAHEGEPFHETLRKLSTQPFRQWLTPLKAIRTEEAIFFHPIDLDLENK